MPTWLRKLKGLALQQDWDEDYKLQIISSAAWYMDFQCVACWPRFAAARSFSLVGLEQCLIIMTQQGWAFSSKTGGGLCLAILAAGALPVVECMSLGVGTNRH